ncbi:ABC transporter [Exiguobacterium sp. BMC-KP]|uniref:ribosomal protection-like ABC-F family protein n=1 Tax=Exiguobacterium sp. BMC-KP TaxID=1684312 RepID=UPI0006AA4579|nr:ABC-F type ribosomal protection protein [Exiguobacterium sp. BMC-KP]KOP30969.1 ABC transporter [Exiguobacterium sp. BMC-KP]
MPTETLTIQHLSMDYDERRLFSDVSFHIHAGEHVALIGPNGIGKTTLLHLIADQLQPTDGSIKRHFKKLGLLSQHFVAGNHTVLDVVERADLVRYQLRADAMNGDLTVYQQALDLDAFSLEADATRVLKEVKLDEVLWRHEASSLSGGEQTRLQLACLLLLRPDFIILDEPTNHLDQETLDWLTEWVNTSRVSILYVSHERFFIDATADAVIELSESGATRYNGNYQFYKEQKEHQALSQQRAYEKQERTRKELTRMIQGYRQWHQKASDQASERDPYAKKKAAKHATKVKAKEQQLERLLEDRVKKTEVAPTVHVAFEHEAIHAKRLVSFEHVTFRHGTKTILNDISFSIDRSDRIAVTGPNGSGKTTLLRLIEGEYIPNQGRVLRHPRLKTGYFSQALSHLPTSGTLLDALLEFGTMSETDARTLLACFLFRRDDVYRSITDASMGEKCRIAFLRLYFSGAHLLILDEPTNYLDLATREQIEAALDVFPGELLFVSHDRYFTDRLSNRTFDLTAGFEDHPVGTATVRNARHSDLEAIQSDLTRLDALTGIVPFNTASNESPEKE